MKKIFLTLFALLAFAFNVQADNIVSGQKYKIVTLDGTKALSCGEVAKNNVTLTLTDLSDTEEGQPGMGTDPKRRLLGHNLGNGGI